MEVGRVGPSAPRLHHRRLLQLDLGRRHLEPAGLDGTVHTYDVEGFKRVSRLNMESEPVDYDVEGSFEHAFGRHTDFPPQVVVLRVTNMAARQLRRRRFHPTQTIDEDDHHSLTTQFRVGVGPEFKAWLLGLAPELEVVSPQWFRVELGHRHAAGAAGHRPTRTSDS